MNKILVIFVSRDINISHKRTLLTIKNNLVDSLKNDDTIIDLCSVLSQPDTNMILKNIKLIIIRVIKKI